MSDSVTVNGAAPTFGGTVSTVLETPRTTLPPATLEEARTAPGRRERIEEITRRIEDEGIKYIFFQQVSVSGHVNGKGVSASMWEKVAEDGYQLVYGATADLFVDREDRKARRYELKAEIEQALAKKSAKEWAHLFNENGVPAGEVLSIPEVLAHPQIIERNLLKSFDTTAGVERAIAVVRSGFRLASGDPQPATPPPSLGADTEEILKELGYDKDAIGKLRADGAV